MTDKKTESIPKEESRASDFNLPCGNFEEMSKMMQNFCGGGESSFDCGAMIRTMFGNRPEDETKNKDESSN